MDSWGNIVRFKVILMLLAVVLTTTAGPAWATGLGGAGPCVARNAMEVYCINHGGCPKSGYCNFPDGSYCSLGSFYNGTCPGREYYEQAIWMSEANRFLNGDEGYYPAYLPSSYPYYNYYYWPTPTYGPGYGPYWP